MMTAVVRPDAMFAMSAMSAMIPGTIGDHPTGAIAETAEDAVMTTGTTGGAMPENRGGIAGMTAGVESADVVATRRRGAHHAVAIPRDDINVQAVGPAHHHQLAMASCVWLGRFR